MKTKSVKKEYKKNENEKIYLMSLLYKQTKELHEFYNSPIESSKYYYLVNKEWLDDVKKANNYRNIIESSYIYNYSQNYSEFKQNLSKLLNLNEIEIVNNIEDAGENNNNYFCYKIKLENCEKNIIYPKNGELIKQEYFSNTSGSLGNNNPLFEVLIGYKSIILIDNNLKNTIYICSLVNDEEMNNNNFFVKIDGILCFEINDEEGIFERELKKIKAFQGIDNYLKKRKLDISKQYKQKIIDLEDDELGYFYNLKGKEEEKEKEKEKNNCAPAISNNSFLYHEKIKESSIIYETDIYNDKFEKKQNINVKHYNSQPINEDEHLSIPLFNINSVLRNNKSKITPSCDRNKDKQSKLKNLEIQENKKLTKINDNIFENPIISVYKRLKNNLKNIRDCENDVKKINKFSDINIGNKIKKDVNNNQTKKFPNDKNNKRNFNKNIYNNNNNNFNNYDNSSGNYRIQNQEMINNMEFMNKLQNMGMMGINNNMNNININQNNNLINNLNNNPNNNNIFNNINNKIINLDNSFINKISTSLNNNADNYMNSNMNNFMENNFNPFNMNYNNYNNMNNVINNMNNFNNNMNNCNMINNMNKNMIINMNNNMDNNNMNYNNMNININDINKNMNNINNNKVNLSESVHFGNDGYICNTLKGWNKNSDIN